VRSIPNITGCAAAGFQDASLWEEAKRKGDVTIKALIDKALENTSVTVVFVGSQTAGRKYINYEIDRSIARGNGIVAVQIHHLKDKNGLVDPAGAIPAKITTGGYKAYKYMDHESLARWIEAAAKDAGH
jgi:hypothetical protein